MKIQIKTYDHVVVFAAEELKKYLKMMFPDFDSSLSFQGDDGIRIGVFEDLGLSCECCGDKVLDDIIRIDMKRETGVIAGSNPRSVLLAVYEYLRRQGCRWLFPGADGESIPTPERLADVEVLHKASMRFRGQCIEGGVSIQNVLDAIDYAPKVGMNSFMLECFSPLGYLNNWYSHPGNDRKRPEPITEETAMQWKRMCEAEISKRGLLYHDMGHGFTTLAFGIDEHSDLSAFREFDFLAKLGGVRTFHKGQPIETNFCMSNEAARKRFVNFIADYASAHGNVDLLHIWLADGMNNHCECEQCAAMTPSDWYVLILNEIDAELTRRGLGTKLVFVVYCDLLWAPEQETFRNPDRFVLLFAPIARDYTVNYGIEPDAASVTPYERNRLVNPNDMASNLGYLKKWQDCFDGSCFAYEYHFYFLTYFDLSGISLAKCACADVLGLKKNGIFGMIEDQSQRFGFPNNFPIYAWARTMWDDAVSTDALAAEYFPAAYGGDWNAAYDYLNRVGELLSFDYMVQKLKGKGTLRSERMVENMEKLRQTAAAFIPVCEQNLDADRRCASVSWQLLRLHCDLCLLFAEFIAAAAREDFADAKEKLNATVAFLAEREDFFQPYFDLFLFKLHMEVALRNREQTLDLI